MLNFRSQDTCPKKPGDNEGSLRTRMSLGLDKFQLFKRYPLQLQLFPCVEQASPMTFIRYLKKQANTKHVWGGRSYRQYTQIGYLFSPKHLFSWNSEGLSLSLRSWSFHTIRLKSTTGFKSDMREGRQDRINHSTKQNNHKTKHRVVFTSADHY